MNEPCLRQICFWSETPTYLILSYFVFEHPCCINKIDVWLKVIIVWTCLDLPLHHWICSASQDSSLFSPPSHIPTRVRFSSSGESVDKWPHSTLGLSCSSSGTAIYERVLAGFNVINRHLPRRTQAGQGQPALHCLDREITSKQPAACVKKILHSGSAQMNPGGAWNCF